MAKKLRKPRTSISVLFVILLMPWIVMGGVAAIASLVLGLPDYASILIALACALAVTFLVRDYDKRSRGR